MRTMKKITSIILTFCMIVSVVCVGGTAANADSSPEYAQSTINGSAILHCFNWSYNNIKNNLKAIHDAGYTAVQTSPVQQPKDYDSSYTDESGQWWKLYQPLGLRIAPDNNGSATSWLGTKSELTSLCAEAETYGIKVIVDIVSNHVANDGEEKGTFQHINDAVDTNLKNALYYHSNSKRTNDNNRYNMTQLHLGMPDLNTANTTIQNMVLALLEECVDCGVDGFRFDTAKHIELPTDDSSCKSDYWKNVIDGIKAYCEDYNKPEPFIYGEILGYAGTSMSNYHTYMSVTDSAASCAASPPRTRQSISERNPAALPAAIAAAQSRQNSLTATSDDVSA
ncbi:MAG: hypothetical protein IIU39_08105, partial [Ruminococcus sp.]|nr:hypothetical protein [Ruminococcus sp.]